MLKKCIIFTMILIVLSMPAWANSQNWIDKGNDYMEDGRYDKAIKCYDKAINENPYSSEAWHCKGIAYQCMNDWDNAERCFKYMSECDKYNKKHHINENYGNDEYYYDNGYYEENGPPPGNHGNNGYHGNNGPPPPGNHGNNGYHGNNGPPPGNPDDNEYHGNNNGNHGNHGNNEYHGNNH